MKIIVLGNYKPSGHACGRIIDKSGIAPTVTCITVNDENLTLDEKIELVRLFIVRRNGYVK